MNLFKLIKKNKEKEEDLIKILSLLLTEKELKSIEERINILNKLCEQKTQRQIASELNCSVVTVTRGAKVFNKNKEFIIKTISN